MFATHIIYKGLVSRHISNWYKSIGIKKKKWPVTKQAKVTKRQYEWPISIYKNIQPH